MNRHLCRGKRLDNGEWIQGNLVQSEREDGVVTGSYIMPKIFAASVSDGDLLLGGWYKVDPTTVGHCTGLVAAKSYRGDTEADRLIWEGDILRIFGGSTSEVIGILGWCQHDQCYVVFKDINANEHIFDFGNFDSSEYAEIISTIHDEGSAE